MNSSSTRRSHAKPSKVLAKRSKMKVKKRQPAAKKWAKTHTSPAIYDFKKSPSLKKGLKELAVPKHVKTILSSLDKINETDGILVIKNAIDLAAIFMIVAHKNAKQINEIRQANWKAIDLKTIKNDHSENITEFKRLFCLDVPDFIFELHHYHECMSAFVKGWKGNLRYIDDIEGFGTLRDGIFKHVFTKRKPKEKDALSLRYGHHSLNFFPLFSYGSDFVTQGLIFDYHENCFSPFIGYLGDGDYYGKAGIWDCLFDVFHELEPDDDGFESNDDRTEQQGVLSFAKKKFTYDQLNELLEENEDPLCFWFYGLATIGYLNFHGMPSIKFDQADKMRYDRYLIDTKSKDLSSKNTFFEADRYYIYPILPIKIDENFNPIFSYQVLESFLAVLDIPGDINRKIERFVGDKKKINAQVLGLMGLNAKEWLSKKTISSQDEEIFLTALEKFCNDEIKAGRPYLAFLVGMYAWAGVEKQTTKLAARLLQNVPDEICHPIIKTVASLHAETRFHARIYM